MWTLFKFLMQSIKDNHVIYLILFISVVIVIINGLNILHDEISYFWRYMFEDVVFLLSMAYVGSFIFFIIVYEMPRLKYQAIALKKLRDQFNHHMKVFQRLYKAIMKNPQKNEYKNLNEVFDENFFKEIDNFDDQREAPTFKSKTWMEYLKKECERLDAELNRIIIQYSFFLSNNITEQLDEIQSSYFMLTILDKKAGGYQIFKKRGDKWRINQDAQDIKKILETQKNDSKYNILNLEEKNKKKIGVKYIQTLLKFIDLLNSSIDNNIKPDKGILGKRSVPEYGSARRNKRK